MIGRSLFKQSALRSATLLTLVNILTTATTLASGLYIARQLDPQQYGQYAYMANVFLLLTLFLGFGLTGQIAKDVAERADAVTETFQQQVRGLAALRIVTAGSALICGSCLWLLSHEIAYAYAGAGAALFMYVDFAIGALSGLQRLQRVALLLTVQPLVSIATVLILPLDHVIQVYNLFLASHLASAVCGTLLLARLPEIQLHPWFSAIKHLRWREMVAGHVYLAVLLQTAYAAYGVTLVGGLKEYSAAGELSIAFTIARMLPLLSGTLVSVIYYPRLCALYKHGVPQRLKQTAGLVYDLATIAAAGSSALLLAYSDVIVPLLYTERHSAAIPLLHILAGMSFFGVTDQVLTWTLIAADRPWQALKPLLVRMALVLLTWPLTRLVPPSELPRMIAVAYIVSSGVGWLTQLRYARFTPMLRGMGSALIMFVAGFAIALLVRSVTPWPQLSYVEVGGLIVATGLYGCGGLMLIWHRLDARRAVVSERV